GGQVLPGVNGPSGGQAPAQQAGPKGSPVQLPDGNYRIKVMALRVLSRPDNDSNFDTWLSPLIPIRRACAPPPGNSPSPAAGTPQPVTSAPLPATGAPSPVTSAPSPATSAVTQPTPSPLPLP